MRLLGRRKYVSQLSPPLFIGLSLNLEKDFLLNVHDDVLAAPVALSPLCMYKKNRC